MAATTIVSRPTWTDDTGTPAAPNADGTIINNARLQADVYDVIDAILGGGASYPAFTLGGTLATEGLGTSAEFHGAGTGFGQTISVRNTSSGTTSFAGIRIGNDTGEGRCNLLVTASNYTAQTIFTQAGVTLEAKDAGGINIAASHASGAINVYAGGTTEKWRFTADGALMLRTNAGHPTAPPSSADWSIYVKGNLLVFVYNDAGTPSYFSIAGDQSGGTWAQSTSAP